MITWTTSAAARIANLMAHGQSRMAAVEQMQRDLSRKTTDPQYGTAASWDAHAYPSGTDANRAARRRFMDKLRAA